MPALRVFTPLTLAACLFMPACTHSEPTVEREVMASSELRSSSATEAPASPGHTGRPTDVQAQATIENLPHERFARTRWPQDLPCNTFSEVSFDVRGDNGTFFDEPSVEIAWRTEDSRTFRFLPTRRGPSPGLLRPVPVVDRLPVGLLAEVGLPGHATTAGPHIDIWLQCAGPEVAGIEWICRGATECDVGVIYPPGHVGVAPELVEFTTPGPMSRRIGRVVSAEPTPFGSEARRELQTILHWLGSATESWLEVVCRSERCAPVITAAQASLSRFLAAPDIHIVSAEQRAVRDDEHYPMGYPRIEVIADAGGESVALGWSEAEDFTITFGQSGPGRLTCRGYGCSVGVVGVSIGWTGRFKVVSDGAFGIRMPSLQLRAR